MSSGVEAVPASLQRFSLNTEGYLPFSSDLDLQKKAGSTDKSLLLNIPRFSNEKSTTSDSKLKYPPFNTGPYSNQLSKLGEFYTESQKYMAQHLEKNLISPDMMRNGEKSPNPISQSPGLLRNILQHRENLHQDGQTRDNNNSKDINSTNDTDGCVDDDKIGETNFSGENDNISVNSGEFSGEESDFERHNSTSRLNDEDDVLDEEYEMMNNGDDGSEFCDNEEEEDSKEAKRARVEDILTNMRQSPNNVDDPANGNNSEVRRKRKQYQPKWLEHSENKFRKLERLALQDQLIHLKNQLTIVQRRYIELFDGDQMSAGKALEELRNRDTTESSDINAEQMSNKQQIATSDKLHEGFKLFQPHLDVNPIKQYPSVNNYKQSGIDILAGKSARHADLNIQNLSESLKSQISNVVSSTVDSVLGNYLKEETPLHKDDKEVKPPKEHVQQPKEQKREKPEMKPIIDKTPKPMGSMEPNPFLHDSYRHDHIGNIARVLEQAHSAFEAPRGFTPDFYRHAHNTLPFPLPPFGCFPPSMLHPPTSMASMYSPAPVVSEPEQTEALPLVVNQTPKKKRTKVTDTRLSPRAARALLGHDALGFGDMDRHPYAALMPPVLPTSVAIPNPGLKHSNVLECYYTGYGFPEPRSSNHSPLDMDHNMSPSTNMSSSPTEGMSMHMKSEMMSMDDSYEGQSHMISFL